MFSTTQLGKAAAYTVAGSKDPGDMFRQYLSMRGLKQTAQRAKILEVFLDMGGHPSMDDVHEALARRGWQVGVATVYRTMRLLLDAGVARRQRFGDGVERYEVMVGRRHHIHFICEICGQRMDVVAPDVERDYAELAKANSFLLGTHETYLYGVCAECSRLLKTATKQEHDNDYEKGGRI